MVETVVDIIDIASDVIGDVMDTFEGVGISTMSDVRRLEGTWLDWNRTKCLIHKFF